MISEIKYIKPLSIAEEVGIEPGDKLLKINDNDIQDIIDYKYLITDEILVLEIFKKEENEIWEIEIEKDYDEDLGLEFEEPILDNPKNCHNKCVFCFIDQLPKGMRETLYFKDDDSRLSFLQGNFITMTNMTEEDIDRIIKYKISPINVSVHTTNESLRCKMMNNRFAGNVYERMKKLAKNGIMMNSQIVVCPGYNDGEEFIKTMEDLYKLYPNVNNVAAVPIGVTKFREESNLPHIEIFNKKTSKELLDKVSVYQRKFLKEHGEVFIRLSDEFYILAGEEIPSSDFYKGFEQLEDGIGTVRKLRDNISITLEDLRDDLNENILFVTGTLAYDEIVSVANLIMNKNSKLNIKVKKIVNNFFGETITVSGLLTGKDILEQVQGDLKEFNYVILPNNVIRKGYELNKSEELVLLDDITVEELKNKLNKKVLLCDYNGEDLIHIINHIHEEE
jgi:putative radical SAM enzyme (TIGR03279 family)